VPTSDGHRGTLLAVLAVLIVIGLAVVVAIVLLGHSGGNGQAGSATKPGTTQAVRPTAGSQKVTRHSKSATKSHKTSRAPSSSVATRAASTTASSASSSASTSPAGAGPPSGPQLAQAVRDYYALLPGNTDAGWQRLTAGYQQSTARNRQTYEQFWGAIRSVNVAGASGSAPDTVQATVTYVYKDGRVFDELTSFRLVRENGILKIAGSHVDSSVSR
jgi:hypothetical protein